MKNISLILNIVLVVAVIILYVDRFKGSSDGSPKVEKSTSSDANTDIVYVNLDSLMNSYDLYNELKTELIQEQQKLETNLNSKLRAYQRRAMEFQQKVEKRLVTTSQAEKMQQQLMNEQQKLAKLKEQLQMQLMEKEQAMTKQIYDKLHAFLDKYNDDNKHKLILGNTMGNVVLKAQEGLDITDAILSGLNSEYQNAAANTTDEGETDKK